MNLPESTRNIIISGLMGAIGGFISIPLNAYIMWRLKKNEQFYQHKLDIVAKQRELLLHHRLEMERLRFENADINRVKQSVIFLEHELSDIKKKFFQEGTGV